MIFLNRNRICNKIVWHTLQIFVGLTLLLCSMTATAISCPGSEDFMHVSGLWGWSWGLRPGHEDFISLPGNPPLWTPKENDFSPNYPLSLGVYFITIDVATHTAVALLYCTYTLSDGKVISVQTKEKKQFSLDELNRIAQWKTAKTSIVVDRYLITSDGYECSTTAGTANQCSIDLI